MQWAWCACDAGMVIIADPLSAHLMRAKPLCVARATSGHTRVVLTQVALCGAPIYRGLRMMMIVPHHLQPQMTAEGVV